MRRQWVILQLASHPRKPPEGRKQRVLPSHLQLVRNKNLRSWTSKWTVHYHLEEPARYSWTGALTASFGELSGMGNKAISATVATSLSHRTSNSAEFRHSPSLREQWYPPTKNPPFVPTHPYSVSLNLPTSTPQPEQQHKKTTNTNDQTRRTDHRSGHHQWQKQTEKEQLSQQRQSKYQ